MILEHMAALRGARIVLASGSPRRREILNDNIGLCVSPVPRCCRAPHYFLASHCGQPG